MLIKYIHKFHHYVHLYSERDCGPLPELSMETEQLDLGFGSIRTIDGSEITVLCRENYGILNGMAGPTYNYTLQCVDGNWTGARTCGNNLVSALILLI